MLIAIGNISFIVGSVYFLPSQKAIVGDDIFIVASIFVTLPQILTCFGLYSNSRFNEKFHDKYLPIKKYVIFSSIILSIACVMFVVGTVEFKDQNSETIGLYVEGVVFFILGSALFLFASLVGAYLRHYYIKKTDLAETFIEMQSFRP